MEGMERAKLPIADYTEVNKEENGRNGKSKVTYSRLHRGKQGREWKEWKEQRQASILRERLEQTEIAQDHHQKGHLKNK